MIKQKNKQLDFDTIIIGGGMVGMAAALSLVKLGLKVALIESQVSDTDSHPSYDDRTLVINQASIRFWKKIKVWNKVSHQATAINKVHVTNKGHFGSVTFNHKEIETDVLAYIVEAKILGIALKQTCEQNKLITIIAPAQYKQMYFHNVSVDVHYTIDNSLHKISSQLVLAADGIQSGIRKELGLETIIKSYQKTAIICNITPEHNHQNCAYEQLSQQGPTALLPFLNNRCGFVWTVEEKHAKDILSLDDGSFLKKAQKQFGYRMGAFTKVGKRSSYPLFLVTVPQQVKSRVALIGNAAHGMSPVSAQGLNLAVRDVARLYDVIAKRVKNGKDIGSHQTLQDYQKSINDDQQNTMRYTDDLMSWFKIDEPMVSSIRSVGLFALNQSSHLKKGLFKRVSGFRGDIPQLMRKNNETS